MKKASGNSSLTMGSRPPCPGREVRTVCTSWSVRRLPGWDIVTEHDSHFDTLYRRGLIERGIYYFPVPTKQGSISFAHSEDDIDSTLTATDEVLTELSS